MSKNPTFNFTRFAVTVVAGVVCMFPAVGADSARVGAYDFSYASTGDARARPVQVFDDGRSTFFQFRPGESIPAIFSTKTGAPQLLSPQHEGPYIKVPEVHGRFVLQVGRAQAMVAHAGGTRVDAPQLNVVADSGITAPYAGGGYPQGARLVASLAPVAGALVDDARERNSYATPRKGDAVTWQAGETAKRDERDVWFVRGSAQLNADSAGQILAAVRAAPAGSRFVLIGRDDDTYKEGLDAARSQALRTAFGRAGVAADRITVRTGVAGKSKGRLWASSIWIESEQRSEQPARGDRSVVANLQSLVRSGVLRLDQAEAIAAQYRAAPPADTQPQRVMAAAADPQAPREWRIRKADQSIEKTLARWGAEADWTVVWKDAPAISVTGDGPPLRSDFLTAAEYVISKSQEAGYSIRATAYSNRTLVITTGK